MRRSMSRGLKRQVRRWYPGCRLSRPERKKLTEREMDKFKNNKDVNLITYCSIVLRHKAVVTGVVMAGALLAIVLSLITPDIYRADAVITPVQARDTSMDSGLTTF